MRWTNRTVAWVGAGVVLALAVGLGIAFLGGNRPASVEGAGQPQAEKGQGPPRVKVVQPAKHVSTPQPAHVEAYERTDIHAKVSGYVDVIGPALGADDKPILDAKDVSISLVIGSCFSKPRPLDIGARVKKGQVLAELWVPEMKQDLVRKTALVKKAAAELGQANAAVEAAQDMAVAAGEKVKEISSLVAKYQADVIYRTGEHKRFVGLFERKVVSEDLVDKEANQLSAAAAALAAAKNAVGTAAANAKVEQAKLKQAQEDVKAAAARLEVAQADHKHMQIMVDYATIKAPYDGIITRRLVDTGTFVQSAATGKTEPVFTVARDDRLRIVVDMPEAEASLVAVGQEASFQPNGFLQPLKGKVVRYADALSSGTRTMRTEVELDTQSPPPKGEGVRLRPGMFGSVTIFPKTLTLPTSALTADNKPTVLCVDKKGRVQRCEIEVGYNDGAVLHITRGLTADAQVIADGRASVREGQTVAIVK